MPVSSWSSGEDAEIEVIVEGAGESALVELADPHWDGQRAAERPCSRLVCSLAERNPSRLPWKIGGRRGKIVYPGQFQPA
jgi:hypothetical protein